MPSPEAKGKYSPETTPLKVGDRVFLCSAKNIIMALDAGTGKEWWRYDPKVPDDAIPYGATCRGVAYYVDTTAAPDALCAKRIIEGTLDARLIAVDAETGQLCPDFGTKGDGRSACRHGRFRARLVRQRRRPGDRPKHRRHRRTGSRRPGGGCPLRRDPRLRRGDRQARLGVGHVQSRPYRGAAGRPDLHPRHAQHVDIARRRQRTRLRLRAPRQLRRRLLRRQPQGMRERVQQFPGRHRRHHRQAGLALPDRPLRPLGLRSRVAAIGGRRVARQRYGAGRDPAEQAGRDLHARQEDRQIPVPGRRAHGAERRRRSRQLVADPALLGIRHARPAAAPRERHVGDVAARSAVVPHPVPPLHL